MKARRFYHCRTCKDETPQAFMGGQNGNRPLVEYWRCTICGETYYALADVGDAEGLCIQVLREQAATIPRHEHDDVLAELRLAIWNAYDRFDGRGTFLGYATARLRNAISNWRRRELFDQRSDRTTRRAHADAVSLDELREQREGSVDIGDIAATRRLDAPLREGLVDRDEASLADLMRSSRQRYRSLVRQDALMGRDADAHAAR